MTCSFGIGNRSSKCCEIRFLVLLHVDAPNLRLEIIESHDNPNRKSHRKCLANDFKPIDQWPALLDSVIILVISSIFLFARPNEPSYSDVSIPFIVKTLFVMADILSSWPVSLPSYLWSFGVTQCNDARTERGHKPLSRFLDKTVCACWGDLSCERFWVSSLVGWLCDRGWGPRRLWE